MRSQHWTNEVFSTEVKALSEHAVGYQVHSSINLNKLFESTSTMAHIPRNHSFQQVKLEVKAKYRLRGNELVLVGAASTDYQHRDRSRSADVDEFLAREEESDLQSIKTSNQRGRALEEERFCQVNNPMESRIEERCTSRAHTFSLTFLKCTVLLQALVLLVILGLMLICYFQFGSMNRAMKDEVQLEYDRSNQVKTIFLFFYQYYQYYMVKNYPEYFLSVADYNTTALE